MDNLKIATAQFEHKSANKAYNLAIIERLAQEAAAQGAEVIAFHECSVKKLCATLEADPQTICFEPGDPDEKEADQLQKVPATESTDNASIRRDASRAIKYINFSSLTVLLLPFSNLISTAVFFFIFKKKLNHAINGVTALKILSFQIIWSIATILLMIAVPLFIFLFPTIPASMLDIPTFIWVYWFMLSFQLITTLVISFHLNKTDNPIHFIPNIL